MRKAFLKAARERLAEMRRQVLKDINNDLRQGREGAKDEGMDTYDLASEERDREISFILTDRERDKLQAIQDAIERIEAGTYGVCESCESGTNPSTPRGSSTITPFSMMRTIFPSTGVPTLYVFSNASHGLS